MVALSGSPSCLQLCASLCCALRRVLTLLAALCCCAVLYCAVRAHPAPLPLLPALQVPQPQPPAAPPEPVLRPPPQPLLRPQPLAAAPQPAQPLPCEAQAQPFARQAPAQPFPRQAQVALPRQGQVSLTCQGQVAVPLASPSVQEPPPLPLPC